MTGPDLTRLRDLDKAATQPPWEAYSVPADKQAGTPDRSCVEIGDREVSLDWLDGSFLDGALIAEMRNALPDLLDLIDAQAAQLDAVRALHWRVDIEPANSICAECSHRSPNGRYMPVEEWPCATIRAITDPTEGA